ncbi:hypothetical protein EPO15_17965 [bacterium]|nr:MAG: hypothetical protein EPO15_17965 [bacterium]
MMVKKAISAVLGGALALSSFLCLGMGMDMGTAWTPKQAHDCCPGQAPEKADSNCCLLLPGALSASVALPAPILSAFFVAVFEFAPAASVRSRFIAQHGPPGASSPGHASPAAPRAPPVA